MQGCEGTAVMDPLGRVGPTLREAAQQARYGVAYLRSICAQAGYGLSETSADEDVLAIDCTLETRGIGIRVQVKCTTKAFSHRTRELSWHVQDHWRKRWSTSHIPVYFVVVKLTSAVPQRWISHESDSTSHGAAAYWVAVDPGAIPNRVRVPGSNRLTADTLSVWDKEVAALFGGSSGK
jgi:hypothetical protein